MTDLATLQARLAEAETALHSLSVSGSRVRVQYEGKLVEYSQTSVAQLRAYIADLRAQIADLGGEGGSRRRAIGVMF